MLYIKVLNQHANTVNKSVIQAETRSHYTPNEIETIQYVFYLRFSGNIMELNLT